MSVQVYREHFSKFSSKKIGVIGDLILDIYHRGDTDRISPEAPVPVVNIDHIDYHPGGAANVAMNLRSLNAGVELFGITGADKNGELLRDELNRAGIGTRGILTSNDHPTTAKTRVIAGSQHVVRTDLENTQPLSRDAQHEVIGQIQNDIDTFDAIILQDYNKGVLEPEFIKKIITLAGEYNTVVTVDPKFRNFFEFANATLIKPNLIEVENILARQIHKKDEIIEAGTELIRRLHLDYLLITLGSRGMALFQQNNRTDWLETEARNVADVSGAGDTVISTVTLALASGIPMKEAAILGNIAAGRVCEEVGIVPIQYDQLLQSLNSYTPG